MTLVITGPISFGGGSMNLLPPPSAPCAPIMGNVSYSINNTGNANTFANVTFTPQYDGGYGVSNYTVTSNTGISASSLNTTITVNGLTKGNTYTFTAVAVNAIGTGKPSNVSIAVTPVTVPSPPSIISANVISCSANVFFSGSNDAGGNAIFTYTAVSSPGCISANSTTSPIFVGGLNSCNNYTFTVKALNYIGASASSGISNSISTSSAPGQLWGWGYNCYKQLGIGNTTTKYSSPKQVGSLTNWQNVSIGKLVTLAVDTSGKLWSWGACSYGSLGLGTNCAGSIGSPAQIGALTNWKTGIATQTYIGAAIKTDGTLWMWGYCINGRGGALGLHTSSPTQVGSCTNWKQVTYGQCSTALAIKTDGTLWAWGRAYYGVLGNNNNSVNQSSPVQIGALTNWSSLGYHLVSGVQAAAIKTDGTYWIWGCGTRSSPVQFGSLSNWKQVSPGSALNAGIKTDGSLWSWGNCYKGSLGRGTSCAGLNTSPVQIGALTNWKKIDGYSFNGYALKADGTYWVWGGCTIYGQLGVGCTGQYSSPKQVGSATTWTNLAAGCYTTFGIRT